MSKTPDPFTAGFSENPDFDFEIRTVIGHSFAGASDAGEVLAAVGGIGKNDHDGWYEAWLALGDRLSAIADTADKAGHRQSAASAYLRASTYYGVAVNAISALGTTDELVPTFRRHRTAWDRFVDTTSTLVERVEIPYEDTTMPGYLFHPGAGEKPRPALVVANGSDGSLSSLWASCISGGLRRGYHVLVFDGPGQQSMLFERDVLFRPDWEAVLTPVFDVVAARPEIDDGRVALYGISQAGYWVPRALAFEHRFAAAIADPGVVDVSTSWLDRMPKHLLTLLDEGKDEKFDKDLALGFRFSPGLAHTWNFRARPYGSTGYAETLREVRRYTVADVAGRITTPLLITDPEDEQFWPGQAARLAELTSSVSTLVPFTAAEGANFHCQPMARALTEQRMFDWLDETLTP